MFILRIIIFNGVFVQYCSITIITKLTNTKKVVSESINIPNIIDRDRKLTNSSCSNNLSLLVSSESHNTFFFNN